VGRDDGVDAKGQEPSRDVVAQGKDGQQHVRLVRFGLQRVDGFVPASCVSEAVRVAFGRCLSSADQRDLRARGPWCCRQVPRHREDDSFDDIAISVES
jgi:hypothetical protein